MTQPKGHHFVPELLLKRFADEQGWLHFARKAEASAIRPTRINKAFKQSHLYSQLSETGKKDPVVERELAQLEYQADRVLNKIIEAASRDQLPALTAQEFETWYRFFLVQWKRVPDLHAEIASDDMARDMLAEIHEELRVAHPDKKAALDALSTPEEVARTIRNTRARAILQISPRITELFRARGIRILRHRRPGKAFVIGSRPVIQMGFKNGLTLFHAATEMWLPVSKDILMGVGAGAPLELLYLDSDDPIRKVNEGVVGQSSSFGSHSPKLIKSLATAVWKSWAAKL